MSLNRAERLEQEFWEFSKKVYGRSEVQSICLRFQDQFGLNVNLLLFCLWQGWEHKQALGKAFFANEIDAFHSLEEKVLTLFRQKRKSSRDLQRGPWLYSALLDIELDLERKAQAQLIAALLKSKSVQRTGQRPELINLHSYIQSRGLALEGELLELVKQLLSNQE